MPERNGSQIVSQRNGAAPAAETQKKLSLVAAELPLSLLLALDAGSWTSWRASTQQKGENGQELARRLQGRHQGGLQGLLRAGNPLERDESPKLSAANKSLTEFIKDITGEKPPTHL